MPKKTTTKEIKGKVKTVKNLPTLSKGWGGLSIGDAMQRVAAEAKAKKKAKKNKENSSIDYSIFQKKLHSLLSEAHPDDPTSLKHSTGNIGIKWTKPKPKKKKKS